jgi:hypothetical protein
MLETIIILAVAAYLLPTILAVILRVPGVWAIFAVNLFFGWTIAGWAVALMWVLKHTVRRERRERVVYIRDPGYYPQYRRP